MKERCKHVLLKIPDVNTTRKNTLSLKQKIVNFLQYFLQIINNIFVMIFVLFRSLSNFSDAVKCTQPKRYVRFTR